MMKITSFIAPSKKGGWMRIGWRHHNRPLLLPRSLRYSVTTFERVGKVPSSTAAAAAHHQRSFSSSTIHTQRSNPSPSSPPLDETTGLLKFETLHELNRNAIEAFRDNPLFGTFAVEEEKKKRSFSSVLREGSEGEKGSTRGEFQWMTYGEFGENVRRCRRVLKDMGITPHSKVGVISNNRHEWATIAAAAYSLNATLVPMYEAQRPSDWKHILIDSGCRALFCATEDCYVQVLKEVLPDVSGATGLGVDGVLCLDGRMGEPHSFATAMRRAEVEGVNVDIDDIVAPTPDDLANLIYTSGTTGKPKGVELIHSNQTSNVHAGKAMSGTDQPFVLPTDRSLAFLPWAHSYGQTCELWCLLSSGSSMGVCRGAPQYVLEDLSLVEPTLLFAVPALYKRVHDGVLAAMQSASPLKRHLLRSALRSGRANTAAADADTALGSFANLKHSILDAAVLSKIRARFGGRLRAGFVAGAACPKEIVDFMDSVGIPICEGYGLTETSPVIAMNVLQRRKAGSVGMPLSGVEVMVLDPEGNELGPNEEGEICCSGPNVMRGYHNNPEATEEVITLAPDGKTRIFHTGDLGKIDATGYISVTGRIKELYKLENGKYVCPTPIEEAISMSRFISQVVVCGANRPYNVALVVPDWEAVRSELKLSSANDDDDMNMTEENLANDVRVAGLINEEIRVHCYGIKKFEVPRLHALVAPFTAANNQITPKMSIRRHVVMKTYEDVIADLYGDGVIGGRGNYHTEEGRAA